MTLGTNAKIHIADRLTTSPSEDKAMWIAIGTGTPSGTALGTETHRKPCTATHSGAVVTYTTKWDVEDIINSFAITEAGIFNQATVGGMMLASSSFGAVNINMYDTLEITWTLTIQ